MNNNTITTKTYLELNETLGKCTDELYFAPRGEVTDDVLRRRARIDGVISKAIRKMAHSVPEDEAQKIINDTLKEFADV